MWRPLCCSFVFCFMPLAAGSADDAVQDEAPPRPAVQPSDKSARPIVDQDDQDEELYELLKLFVDTLDQVDRNYVKDVSRRELMEAAIRGMLSKLDQYSSYIPPTELDGFRKGLDGEFGGIGVRVSIEKGGPTIASPLVGGPAHRAGLIAGDQILRVDGKSTKEVASIDELAKMLKGKVGTAVTLTVRRRADDIIKDVTLDREIVRVPTVLGDCRKPNDKWDYMFDAERKIGYIRINSFGRHTVREMQAAMRELVAQDVAALILDLRYNPGGLLSAAIQVADMFVAEGLIVSTKGRNFEPRSWKARRRGSHTDFPMVVLVNHFSASASEIVAACLQDHQRAVVFGERTWGKGSVQNIIELEAGQSAVKLTTASYFRPSGENIHRQPGTPEDRPWGVQPNDGCLVPLTREQEMEMQAKRRRNDLLRKNDDGNVLHEPHVDPQLRKALDHLQARLRDRPATPSAAP